MCVCVCVCVCVCPDQVQSYLQECERRAAVVIQSFWRGFRERRRYNNTHRHTLRHTHTQQQAARTLQRAVHVLTHTHTHTLTQKHTQNPTGLQLTDVVDSSLFQVRRFLQRRRAAKAPPTTSFLIGQVSGLTDSRRVELKRQVEEHISLHPVRDSIN